jgi:2-dehydro-3-deoxy-D-arabinonate dehydratase
MQLCRVVTPNHGPRTGLLIDARIYDLSASSRPELHSLAALLQASVSRPLGTLLGDIDLATLPSVARADLDRPPAADAPHLLPPVDRQEVWAAGVTYAWSREARVREAVSKDIYVRVYEAERPELFFKSTAEKAVGHRDWIGLRGDSRWNVPEPELALVLNPAMHIVGYTVGNDVSSRDIEGENPLYLPQAKVFRHGCALGPMITLAGDGVDAQDLSIELSIRRGADEVFHGTTSTSKMQRPLQELADYLGRYNDFPDGAVLLTGTGIVPGDDFTLENGDEVAITVDRIGRLVNVVRQM